MVEIVKVQQIVIMLHQNGVRLEKVSLDTVNWKYLIVQWLNGNGKEIIFKRLKRKLIQ